MRTVLGVVTVFVLALAALAPMAAGQELDKKTIKVTASAWESKAHGGFADFPPEATLDGNLAAASSWRADGNGQWIQYDLGAVKRLAEVRIAFVAGDARQYTIDILASKTGAEKEWATAADRVKSSGKTAQYESFKLNGVEARYVRIVGHGNNSEKFPNWINITEVAVVEAGAAKTPATTTAPAAATAAQATKAAEPAPAMKKVLYAKPFSDETMKEFLYDSNPKVKALIIQKKVGGVLTTLAQQPFEYKTGQWYAFQGVVAGDRLEFYMDGKRMLTATATDFKSGPAGLLVWLAEARLEGFHVAGPGE